MPKRKSNTQVVKQAKKPKTRSEVTPLKFDSLFQSSVYSLGSNMTGQLGLGESVDEVNRPQKIDLLDSPMVQISCGGMHTAALLADSSVVTFGCNDDGALGRPAEEFEEEGTPTRVETGFKAIQIAAGDNFTAVLSENGEVYACGSFRNIDGNFGLLAGGEVTETSLRPLPLTVPVTKIAAGYNHLCVLTVEGDILTIGSPEFGQLGRIPSYFSSRFDDWKDSYLSLLPLRDKKLVKISDIWCGGRNTFFQIRTSTRLKHYLYGCGINNYGQLGINNCNDQYFPVPIKMKEWIAQIAIGDHHTLFLTDLGDLYSCGRNVYGQLGVECELEGDSSWLPIKVECGVKFVQCACGPVSSFALSSDGILYSWGACSSILGQGDTGDMLFISKPTPMEFGIKSGFKLTQISAAGIHACLLCTNSSDAFIDNSTCTTVDGTQGNSTTMAGDAPNDSSAMALDAPDNSLATTCDVPDNSSAMPLDVPDNSLTTTCDVPDNSSAMVLDLPDNSSTLMIGLPTDNSANDGPIDNSEPNGVYSPTDNSALKRLCSPTDNSGPNGVYTPTDNSAPKRLCTPNDNSSGNQPSSN